MPAWWPATLGAARTRGLPPERRAAALAGGAGGAATLAGGVEGAAALDPWGSRWWEGRRRWQGARRSGGARSRGLQPMGGTVALAGGPEERRRSV